MNLFQIIIIVTILFIIYYQIFVGSIFFRGDNPYSLLNFLSGMRAMVNHAINPLHSSAMWKPQLLNVNYIFILIITISVYYLIINLKKKINRKNDNKNIK